MKQGILTAPPKCLHVHSIMLHTPYIIAARMFCVELMERESGQQALSYSGT